MTVTPAQVKPNVSVAISVTVTNTGDLTGDYTVALKLNNADYQEKTVTIKGLESLTVSFALTRADAGTYTVTIGVLSGRFSVRAPKPEVTVAAVPAPEPEPTPEPMPQPEEKPETMAQPGPESTPESELPTAPQEETVPSAGISWWLIVIYAAAGIGMVGLVTIIVRGKHRH